MIDDGVELRLHARHGVDLACQRRDEEGVHYRGGRDLEVDRAVDGSCHLVHGGDAVFRIEEEPFPVERDHLHRQRLHVGAERLVGGNAIERAIGVELMGADPGYRAERDDDGKRSRPDDQL